MNVSQEATVAASTARRRRGSCPAPTRPWAKRAGSSCKPPTISGCWRRTRRSTWSATLSRTWTRSGRTPGEGPARQSLHVAVESDHPLKLWELEHGPPQPVDSSLSLTIVWIYLVLLAIGAVGYAIVRWWRSRHAPPAKPTAQRSYSQQLSDRIGRHTVLASRLERAADDADRLGCQEGHHGE